MPIVDIHKICVYIFCVNCPCFIRYIQRHIITSYKTNKIRNIMKVAIIRGGAATLRHLARRPSVFHPVAYEKAKTC